MNAEDTKRYNEGLVSMSKYISKNPSDIDINTYWDTDLIEDSITKAVIGLNESYPSALRWIIQDIKKRGVYFPPSGRDFYMDHFDSMNDHLLDYACIGNPTDYSDLRVTAKQMGVNIELQAYGQISVCYRVQYKELPHGTVFPTSLKPLAYYSTTTLHLGETKTPATGHYFAILPSGEIVTPMRWPKSIGNTVNLNVCNDKRFIWNVSTVESGVNLEFGVGVAQIKSLFYSRDLPLTPAGRKRPILHWVRAHNRRLSEGIDVDVTKHLRGTNVFSMFGSDFIITNPLKAGQTKP